METLKKPIQAIDLAVLAGQKRLSPRTGFVHLFPGEEFTDTIPLYENFCYAFALLRQKTAESVNSAKELMHRLLAFQTEGGDFPVYLHEYPLVFDFHMGLKIAPILHYTLRLFPTILGDLKLKLGSALGKILAKPPEKPFWLNRYRALKGEPLEAMVPIDWIGIEWLITLQLAGQTSFSLPYDPDLQLFLAQNIQEKEEPRPHPIEYLLAEGNYSPRLLKDHPLQLRAALLFPLEFVPMAWQDPVFRLFWKGAKVVHSLVGEGLVFELKEIELGRNDVFEAVLFCDRSLETNITVEGKKATTFQLGDRVQIYTPEKTIELVFELTEGKGDFCGHIFPANRPSQTAKGFVSYDWQIGLRTLRRSPNGRIEIKLGMK